MVDDLKNVRGKSVGVGEDHVLVAVGVQQEVRVGTLPRVDDLIVVAGDQNLLHVWFPLLEDGMLQRRDVLKLVDDEVVDVREQ